jgi:hypothetical protein
MGRCQKYPDEGECHGHDCMDRAGTPCMYDALGKAGTEDIIPENCDRSCTIFCYYYDRCEKKQPMVVTSIGVDLAPGPDKTVQYDCDMGTCPDNFDRTNTACFGCSHLKIIEVGEARKK